MPRDTQLAKHYFPTNFTLAKQLSENLFHFMVWCGMIWYGMVWYGMVWYGMVWYGMVVYGMVYRRYRIHATYVIGVVALCSNASRLSE